MREEGLTINNYGIGKVVADPTWISGAGGFDFSRLIIPVKIELNQLNAKVRPYTILSVQSSLYIQGFPPTTKIADAFIEHFEPLRVSQYSFHHNFTLEFPLDVYKIKRIEETRREDIGIIIKLKFIYGLYSELPDKSTGAPLQFLTEFSSLRVEMNIEIPQSHWIKKVLPGLGLGEFFIVEIPKGDGMIKEAWELMAKAEESFNYWKSKDVYAHCRDIGTLLDNKIKAKKNINNFSKEKWKRSYDKFNHLASLGLHTEDHKKSDKYSPDEIIISKADAEHLIIRTKVLIKYAEALFKDVS